MLFNSFTFLIFFPVVTVLFFLLPHRFRWLLLLAASCVFYMFFIPVYILILVFTILVDYFAGILIENSAQHKKLWLIFSIIANIGTLAFFKYYNFFAHNTNGAFNTHWVLLHVILPIGLSFHTFQALSYTIEVYRGNYKAERHLGLYALYVMFYPQLVAGPIERPKQMFHQFKTEQKFKWQNILDGLRLMIWGFFKKVVIADRLAAYVAAIFAHPAHYNSWNIALGVLFFGIQIYCDFSGYSDIALGSAKTMGFELMLNFNRPYFATSITDYWRRWHISLTTWFNDYLFLPIVANKRNWGNWGIVFGILVTFAISGLWHGAGWTFIFWGLLHGIAMCYEFLTKRLRKSIQQQTPGIIYKTICRIAVFLFLFLTWIFFRATSLRDALHVIRYLFRSNEIPFASGLLYNNFNYGITNLLFVACCIAGMFGIEKIYDPRLLAFNRTIARDILFCSATIVLIIFFGVFTKQSFIYFQF